MLRDTALLILTPDHYWGSEGDIRKVFFANLVYVLANIRDKQERLKLFHLNPRVGDSSVFSTIISLNIIDKLQRLENDCGAIFSSHTS